MRYGMNYMFTPGGHHNANSRVNRYIPAFISADTNEVQVSCFTFLREHQIRFKQNIIISVYRLPDKRI